MQKKICMLGAFAAGKTSLVARFVDNLFSETYLTTVGVKVDKKVVAVGGGPVTLVLWDFAGEDDLQPARPSHLRGAAGCLLVVDGSRPGTLDTAVRIRSTVEATLGEVPFVVALNKSDLRDGGGWRLEPDDLAALRRRGWVLVETSARSGAGVEQAFSLLAEEALRRGLRPTRRGLRPQTTPQGR